MSPGERRVALADVLLGLTAIGIGVVAYAGTLSLPDPVYEPIGPAAFPRTVAILTGAMGLAILVRALRRAAEPPARQLDGGRMGLVLLMAVLTVAYAAAMTVGLLGFRTATVLYMLALGVALFGPHPRKLAAVTVIALVVGIGTHYVFTRVLFLDLP